MRLKFMLTLFFAAALVSIASGQSVDNATKQREGQRARTMRNLHEISQSLTGYSAEHGHFPAALTKKGDKPLLSWRVTILPELGHEKLYNQFHHDEPWDSEHNKKLIEKMPAIFASPFRELKPGVTTYLVPSGKGMMFNGTETSSFGSLSDGPNNTIAVVEVDLDRAVIWTKPDDLVINPEKPTAGLGAIWKDGFYAAFADGSIRLVKLPTAPASLMNKFLIGDGD